ncbi:MULTISPECIES: hypothetical protein [Xenorhabdus]|uniref:Uncharacterized protein n=1 Tax=Xenorhabdus khoisanae TaxID=880157 RepID=A0A0J5FRQ1_9GAMM|nr:MULTISPECIES: hypothetical protein [Xenorhabdus]KLU17146.1 hypothetical protein AAY47_01635 [Xenorhabdus griffiniae]KMJ44958.1 hypothetical protein AB204_11480 [Xenorhabdus khoisanae]KOP32779.1 hypothetical protein AFK69_13825 [Xenorhabdus sp. GDc328]
MNISWQSTATIYRKSETLNIYGEPELQFAGKSPVGIVRFIQAYDRSSVRADSSASRGKADIELFDAVLIFPEKTKLNIDDVLLVEGVKLEIKSIHNRFGLRGKEGHFEVGANLWVSQ